MATSIQDLDMRFPIVNDDGTPTDYFLRLFNDRGRTADETTGEVTDTAQSIGNLQSTIDALALDDLTDVDTTSTPPTDQQALVYDDASGLWLPGDVAAGGGGGGAELIASYDPAIDGASATFDINAATLGDWDEIEIVGRIGTSANSQIFVRMSDNDLATIYQTAGDYQRLSEDTGADVAGSSVIAFTGDTSASPKSFHIFIRRSGTIVFATNEILEKAVGEQTRRFSAGSGDGSGLNSFRILTSSGTMTGGRIDVYKRVNSAGGGGGGSFDIGAVVTASGTQSISGFWPPVTSLDTVEYDSSSFWPGSTNARFVIPEDGLYAFTGYFKFAANTGLGRWIRIRNMTQAKNIAVSSKPSETGHNDPHMNCSGVMYCTAGDEVELSAGNNDTATNISEQRFSVARL